MPRQKVYGKRSRAIYDLNGANISSPDQPCEKPTTKTTTVKQIDVPVRANEARKREKKSERPALGERQNNEVVLPLEVLRYAEADATPKRIPRAKRNNRVVLDSDEENETFTPRRSPRRKQALQHTEVKVCDSRSPKKAVKERLVDDRGTQQCGQRNPPAREHVAEKEKQAQDEQTQQKSANSFDQHCSPLLDLTIHPIGCFESWSTQLSSHFSINKIAEASFGEVYRLSLLEAIPDICRSDESVFKIIPLRAPSSTLPTDKRKRKAALTKQEMMSKPEDVANEVKLLQRMSAIPGFTNFRDMRVLQGRPPEAFSTAFKAWNAEQKTKKKDLSHFPDPSKKASYSEDQLWAVIEMQDAGNDLELMVESGECTSIWTVWDIFWQVVLSLAKGEEGAEFEHRDLHLGNICVRSSPPTTTTKDPLDPARKLGFSAQETTIIDYTISRCLMTSPSNPSIAYTDLSTDPALFEGDSTDEYQYDIYRYMRGVLYGDNAFAEIHHYSPKDLAATGRTWEQYHPQTNLVWLHLVLYKLLEQLEWPSAMKAPSKKTRKVEWRAWKRANDLEHVLLKVQELLDPGAICTNEIWSAGDLVLLALCEGWLDAQDVIGHAEGDESALVSQLEGLELR
ncbi:hypothetical protein M409DRAFT_63447 [Zasmidium cellare ATCC 36951]|uniref:non-specific serine/threonine protein kinase n=1 Tax=Zasmidium cellare ATCC 36951 TaxID=1080233 RepID=A0A6A6D2P3_ZASCE|nr:uncharacterized protein M409DRAFT_63447 [Zasmidium cellare ATCC 36951]KAF2171906.1 hypothetical protein M409DRAFT_63447 [Zasmidium cellare ATCC 36951]